LDSRANSTGKKTLIATAYSDDAPEGREQLERRCNCWQLTRIELNKDSKAFSDETGCGAF